jgi:putative mRNA 3-end processing factor
VLGSCQVRIEHRGEVWVISGDYKTDADPTCAPFDPVRAHTFVTESTFALPVYRWRPPSAVFAEIGQWWRENQAAGRASVLYAYAFGKAQRVLASVDPGIGPIVAHGALAPLNAAYAASGVVLPPVRPVAELPKDFDYSRALVIAPPSARGTPWLRRFGDFTDAFVSGWMLIRGARRRRAVDRGFTLSDHADWPGLNAAIAATGAGRVLVTHGYSAVMVRHLREQGLDAAELETRFEGERDDAADETALEPAAP